MAIIRGWRGVAGAGTPRRQRLVHQYSSALGQWTVDSGLVMGSEQWPCSGCRCLGGWVRWVVA